MTRPRVRRWIGEHPRAAVLGFATAAVAVLVGALPLVGRLVGESVLLGAMAVGACLIGGWSCFVGCVLGRAGLPAERALPRLRWTWPLFAAAFFVAGAARLLLGRWAGRSLQAIVPGLLEVSVGAAALGAIAAVVAWGAAIAGLRLSERITRRMIRRGKWETTVAVGKP